MMFKIIALTILILSGCSANPAKSQKDENSMAHDQPTDVLFVPGMGMGWRALISPKSSEAANYREWEEFNQLFKEKGFNLKVAEVPAMASVAKLSEALRKYIAEEFPADQGRKFHIVAKSMGGLAVRKALSDTSKDSTPLSDQVITFTTISTPHQGSRIADMLNRDEACTPMGKFLMFFAPFTELFANEDYGFQAAGKDLTTCSDALKIEDDKKMEGRTFSFGANLNCDAACRSGFEDRTEIFAEILACWHDMLVKDGVENDGLVTVESASYGKYIETFDGDHVAISEKDFLYKGESVWKKVFTRVLENIRAFEAASPH